MSGRGSRRSTRWSLRSRARSWRRLRSRSKLTPTARKTSEKMRTKTNLSQSSHPLEERKEERERNAKRQGSGQAEWDHHHIQHRNVGASGEKKGKKKKWGLRPTLRFRGSFWWAVPELQLPNLHMQTTTSGQAMLAATMISDPPIAPVGPLGDPSGPRLAAQQVSEAMD